MSAIFNHAPTGDVLFYRPAGAPVRWWFGSGVELYLDVDFSWRDLAGLEYTFGWSGARNYLRFRNAPDGSVLFYDPLNPDVRWYGVTYSIQLDSTWHIQQEKTLDTTWNVWNDLLSSHSWHINDVLSQDLTYHILCQLTRQSGWYIKNQNEYDLSWHIKNQITREMSYRICDQLDKDFAWYDFGQLSRTSSYNIWGDLIFQFSWYTAVEQLETLFSWNLSGSKPHPVFYAKANPILTKFSTDKMTTQYLSNGMSFTICADKVLFTFYPFKRDNESEDSVVIDIEEITGASESLSTSESLVTDSQIEAVLEVLGSYFSKRVPTTFESKQIIFQSRSKKLLDQFKSKFINFNYYSRRGVKYGGKP